MRPKIIIHVGTEKTGSTSIQSLLRESYAPLIDLGVLFPRTIGEPCHINLTACALEKTPNHPIRNLLRLTDSSTFSNFVCETKNKLRKEIEDTSPSVIIISDEHINVHLSRVETLQAYKELCEEFGDIVSVIIYLRPQDEFRLSLFSEAVKSGNLSHFDLDDLLPVFKSIPYRLNYLSILNNLNEVFGDKVVSPKIYDRKLFLQGDICLDFLNVAGIEIQAESLESATVESNPSIDGTIIKHLAQISTVLAKVKNNWSEKLRVIIIKNCKEIFSGPGPVLNRDKHSRYLEQFSAHDKAIRDKYPDLGQAGRNLFPDKCLEKNTKKPIYPGCTISWLEFFIKYVSYINKTDLGICKSVNHDLSDQPNTLEKGSMKAGCTVCGHAYVLDVECNAREGKLCPACGASGRAQAISYHVSNFICNKIVPLTDHKIDKSKRIIGLSDGVVYAKILKIKYDYTNTFFHREPFLDITSPSENFYNSCDLLITTEVFEHIVGPSLDAFHGSYAILKPGGLMILTVPFINIGKSVEHYSENLVNYTSYQQGDGRWVAELEFNDGHKEIDELAKFHGGPGKTLEIRLFNRDRLINELNIAGFVDVEIHDKNMPQYGINWGPASRVITAKKRKN